MSRVFTAMTGTGAPRPAVAVEKPRGTGDETFVVETDGAPFVEVGGPTGPVFSAAPKPAPGVKERTQTASPRPFPRIAPPAAVAPAAVIPVADYPAYLSVSFHETRRPSRPAAGPDGGLVALHFPDHPVSAEYRTLRDEILAQLPAPNPHAVAFTAAAPDAGTTTVLLNLALTFAHAGLRVLVLDANFTRPGAAAKLALPPAPGLAEVIGGQLPLTWALQPTPVPTLQVLTAGAMPHPDAAEVLASAVGRELPKLVGQLRQWFDWVLIDAGVWGMVPERDATCSAADAVYLVTRKPDADRSEFAGLRKWVQKLGGALRGYVTTRV
jgi:Mrp family chromosome partitioning ATPase